MDAMLLHLDEELTNNRSGHSYDSNLTHRDLAFWINFYSLFFDRVFVPANFLTDSNLIPKTFDSLGNFLLEDEHPLWILWDEQRFPFNSFGDFVNSLASPDPWDVSLRNLERSRQTAEFCDRLPKHRIPRTKISVQTYNDESIRIMKSTIFSAGDNRALKEDQCRRLSEALDRIQQRGGIEGYGRNFFYTIFGHGYSEESEAKAKKFADITSSINDLHHPFLTGVDYASHTIKAFMASKAMNARIHCLLPSSYQKIYRRDLSDEMWRKKSDGLTIETPDHHRFQIDRDAVIALDLKKYRVLRTSDEFKELRKSLAACTSDPQMRPEWIVAALDGYLNRISSTLSPVRSSGRNVLNAFSRVCFKDSRYRIGMALCAAGMLMPFSGIEIWGAIGLSVLGIQDGMSAVVDLAKGKAQTSPILPAEGFQLNGDVTVRFKSSSD